MVTFELPSCFSGIYSTNFFQKKTKMLTFELPMLTFELPKCAYFCRTEHVVAQRST